MAIGCPWSDGDGCDGLLACARPKGGDWTGAAWASEDPPIATSRSAVTMPEAGRITRIGVWLRGKAASHSFRGIVWNRSPTPRSWVSG
jgi:hypothetical protein